MSTLFYGKIKGDSIIFEPKDEQEWMMFVAANQNRKIYVDIGFETRARTIPQNSALHVGCALIAKALNDAGLEMQVVLAEKKDIPWSGDLVKELLYRPIMRAMFLKRSTTELTKDEVSEVWEVLMRELGEKHEVEYINFPSKETMNHEKVTA